MIFILKASLALVAHCTRQKQGSQTSQYSDHKELLYTNGPKVLKLKSGIGWEFINCSAFISGAGDWFTLAIYNYNSGRVRLHIDA